MVGRLLKQLRKSFQKSQNDAVAISSENSFADIELHKLHLVFEQTPGAIFILDKMFRFEYVNPGYERISGFSQAELIGKPLSHIFN
ncbi:MAG: PAS domain S-box protein [Paludibacteraceae bacterium]